MNQNLLGSWLRLLIVVGTLLGVLMILVGQFWHGSPILPLRLASDAELYEALHGKTADQVRELLGQPDRTGGARLIGEKEVWQYSAFYQMPKTEHQSPIYVHFNNEGVVSQITLFDGRQVK